MIMMDVDRFKEINDTLGHHFGDQLLIEIGRRLRAHAARERHGRPPRRRRVRGQVHRADARHATEVAARVGTAFDAPFVLGDVSIDVNASLGIALYPGARRRRRHADEARRHRDVRREGEPQRLRDLRAGTRRAQPAPAVADDGAAPGRSRATSWSSTSSRRST